MLLPELRESVLDANQELVRRGLVISTFGNLSGIDREKGLVVIKPSGVPYSEMKAEDLVITDLKGNLVEGKLRPSSDLPTHLVLYSGFPGIGAVGHTHSEYATAWAQARTPIPCFGTTHADYFHGPIPVTEILSETEVDGPYEKNTGDVILRVFEKIDPAAVPGVLVVNHGPFTWGANPKAAAENAAALESIARMAYFTITINPEAQAIGKVLHDRHFLRKHGSKAYYGQAGNK